MSRLTFVAGMPGGGTTATAGILTKNGFWNRGKDDPYFEDHQAACLYTSTLWHKPSSMADSDVVVNYFKSYKQEATANMADRAVVKIAWHMLWCPDVLAQNDVEVLLVARDPTTNAKSIVNRFGSNPGGTDAYDLADEGQARIAELSRTYNWPVWNFGKGANIQELESIVGVGLPVAHFDEKKIKY